MPSSPRRRPVTSWPVRSSAPRVPGAGVVPRIRALGRDPVQALEQGDRPIRLQRLGVPQSSLSRRLKAVEQAVGVKLFQPVGRRVALTAAGQELHDRTRGLVQALGDAVDVVRSDADPDTGLVRFGFPFTLGPVSIPSLLADFHTGAPRIRLHLVQAHGTALVDMVRDGRLDLAVTIPAPDDLPTIILGFQRIHLYVANGHPLATRAHVDLAELADEPFIANPPSYHLRRLLDSWCATAGFTPQVGFEITEFETLRALVAQNLGIAVLPAPELPHPGLTRVPLTGDHDRSIGLISGNHRPTPAVQRLRDHVAAHAMSYLDQARRAEVE
ncbi:LysR family transcriptional regulator [Nocardia seriolae]|nr:LysR family transcriptional regulator [Nocardia seriolae]MTJ71333.1 LysR family transcriptional regulator [Nocardia seriolae]MTJ88560.1 LysR family transcriptional regulator [Nocardia seriolae]MTK32544.1 LysR family transcriptional regulator [Nocardia seriolae]MTK41885.1 LysR family transcriptional regulator [Nocardia seriolae]